MRLGDRISTALMIIDADHHVQESLPDLPD
jgi:hypothetical protein